MQLSCIFFYFCNMVGNKIRNKIISILLLIIYCVGSSSLFVFHDHDHDHDHDSLYCENSHPSSDYESACSHNEHVIKSLKTCYVCDHFLTIDLALLDNGIQKGVQFFCLNSNILCEALYLENRFNFLNKSPPFIV